MTTPDRMASMLAAIQNGLTLAEAKARGLVRDAEDERTWLALKADAAAITARGGRVDIPVEPLA